MTFSPHGVLFQFSSGSTLTLPPQNLTSNACLSTTGNIKRPLCTNINLLHHHLGHQSIHGLLTASDHNVWADSVAQCDLIDKCVTCPLASHKMAMRSKQHVTPPDRPLHTIYVDTIPNPRPKGITAESWCSHFLFLVDHHSRFACLYGMHNKSSQDIITALTKFIAQYGSQVSTGSINTIHADAGTEFKSQAFRTWSSKQKIWTTYAAPKHQHQNGICERHYSTVKDMSRKLLVHARLNTHYVENSIE